MLLIFFNYIDIVYNHTQLKSPFVFRPVQTTGFGEVDMSPKQTSSMDLTAWIWLGAGGLVAVFTVIYVI